MHQNQRSSQGIVYWQKCPRCLAQVKQGQRGVKSFSSTELLNIVAREGVGAIFRCPRCKLPIRVAPLENGKLGLQKPKRRSTASRKRGSERIVRPKPPIQPDADATRKLIAGGPIPNDVEVVVAHSSGDDTIGHGEATINFAQEQAAILANTQRILNLIQLKTLISGYKLTGEVIGRGVESIVAAAHRVDFSDNLVVLKFQVQTYGAGEGVEVNKARVRRTYALQNLVLSDYSARAIELIEYTTGIILVEGYIRGIPLSTALKSGTPVRESAAIELAFQMLDVLQHAWSRAQIVHRDIKPANIMIQYEDGHLVGVLTDYGICRSNMKEGRDSFGVYEDDFEDLDLEGALQTYTNGDIRGTPKYMAPEQIQGAKVDVRTDIYSLGATLYHAITGRAPFNAAIPSDILKKVLYDRPVHPSAVRLADHPSVSPQFAEFVMKCMEKEPSKRYQTPQDAINALTDIHRILHEDPTERPASTGFTDVIMSFFRSK